MSRLRIIDGWASRAPLVSSQAEIRDGSGRSPVFLPTLACRTVDAVLGPKLFSFSLPLRPPLAAPIVDRTCSKMKSVVVLAARHLALPRSLSAIPQSRHVAPYLFRLLFARGHVAKVVDSSSQCYR